MRYDLEKCNRKDIGARIRAERQKRQMTLQKLSSACHLTESGLSKLECGYYFPSADLISRICAELEISVDKLLFGQEPIRCAIYLQMLNEEQVKLFMKKFQDFLNGGKKDVFEFES